MSRYVFYIYVYIYIYYCASTYTTDRFDIAIIILLFNIYFLYLIIIELKAVIIGTENHNSGKRLLYNFCLCTLEKYAGILLLVSSQFF